MLFSIIFKSIFEIYKKALEERSNNKDLQTYQHQSNKNEDEKI